MTSVSGAAFDATVSSAGAGALAAPPTDVVRKTVPPVSGAAAGTTVDTAPADDVGASTTAFEDAAGKTLVSGTASVAGAERGFLPCSPSPPGVWIPRDGCCRAGRPGEQYGSYVGVEGYHRRETIAAAAATVYHHREASAAAVVAVSACHRREASVAAAVAAAACHRREASVAAAAAAAKACHHRETVVAAAAAAAEACYRRPRPPRPENHDRREEHGGAMDVPGIGEE